MKTLPQDELDALARNHQIAIANVDLATHALQHSKNLNDSARLAMLIMIMQYAAARSNYLIQCHLLRVDPTPPAFSDAALPAPTPKPPQSAHARLKALQAQRKAQEESTLPASCQCHLLAVNAENLMPPCPRPMPKLEKCFQHEGHYVTERCLGRSLAFKAVLESPHDSAPNELATSKAEAETLRALRDRYDVIHGTYATGPGAELPCRCRWLKVNSKARKVKRCRHSDPGERMLVTVEGPIITRYCLANLPIRNTQKIALIIPHTDHLYPHEPPK